MELSRAQDGKTLIKLDSWEELGLRIVLPKLKEKIPPDDVGLSLKKVPIEIMLEGDGEPGGEGIIFDADVEPEYCEHGALEGVAVRISNADGAFDLSFLTFPFALDEHDEDGEAG